MFLVKKNVLLVFIPLIPTLKNEVFLRGDRKNCRRPDESEQGRVS
jgi:hypothetical protein